jgi:hypothetical protein
MITLHSAANPFRIYGDEMVCKQKRLAHYQSFVKQDATVLLL